MAVDPVSAVGKVFSSVIDGVFGYFAEKERTKQIYQQVWAQDRLNASAEAIEAQETIQAQEKSKLYLPLAIVLSGLVLGVAYRLTTKNVRFVHAKKKASNA